MPSDAADILIIDPVAGTAMRSAMGASLPSSTKWRNGVLGLDGKIYGIPYSATDILIIDPVAGTATRSTMGATLTGTTKWLGGALAQNGIYGIPHDGADILRIGTSCTNPTGKRGEILYDGNSDTFAGCTPAGWTAFHGSSGSTDGLVGYWKLDETTGTTTADFSGNGFSGTLLGGMTAPTATTTGIVGNAFNIASGDYVRVSNNSTINALNNEISIAFWIKASVSATNNAGVVGKHDIASLGGWKLQQRGTTQTMAASINTSAGAGQFPASTNITNVYDGNWHHIVYSLNNGVIKGYKDGSQVVSTTYLHGTGFGNVQPLLFSYGNFAGTLDDVRLYNRALSAAEVTELASLSSASACINPTGKRGDLTYDGNSNRFVGCTPAGWTAFGAY